MFRKSFRFSIVAVFLISSLAFAQRAVTIEDQMSYRTIGAVEISPDGRWIAYTVGQADYDENVIRSNIYLTDAEGKVQYQLTGGPRNDSSPKWSPDGRWIAFISDRDNKGEKAAKQQIWVISPNGGEAWQLTRTRQAASGFEWSPDGKTIAFIGRDPETDEEAKRKKDKEDWVLVDRDVKIGRIYLADVATKKSEVVFSGKGHIASLDFSPDASTIVFAVQPSPKVPDSFYSSVHILDVANKQSRVLVDQMKAASPKFSPDGKSVAFEGGSKTDWHSNDYVYVVAASGGEPKNMTKAFDADLGAFEWAEDGQSILFAGSVKTQSHVFRASLDGKITPVTAGDGYNATFSHAKGRMAWVFQNTETPAEVYAAEFEPPATPVSRGNKKTAAVAWKWSPRKLTSVNASFAAFTLGKTELMRYKNKKDGWEIEALVTYPPNYKQGEKYPLLLMVHGGPAGIYNQTFTAGRSPYPIQVFANQGYVVIRTNPRGSGGYGEKFRQANIKDWGGMDFLDIQDGVDELIAKGVADESRMGIMGWSYGGFMTTWTVGHTSRFKAASAGAPATNLFSFYGTADIPPFIESYFGGKPWENRELLFKHSPVTYVNQVKTPTLIQHGMSDDRVPITQGDEFYIGLRANSVPTEMIKYPRQPHGLQEPKFVRDAMTRNVEWFDRYVKGNQSAAKWHSQDGITLATQ